MEVEILTIGNELVSGSVIDTNSSYIAQKCAQYGLETIKHTCLGDDLSQLVCAIKQAGNSNKVLIVSGGIGPTLDDLTREAAAKACGVSLQCNLEALKEIQEFFSKLGRVMPEMNQRQACFPKGAIYLSNPIGTAPGFMLKIGMALAFFIPGVPREMRLMLDSQVLPYIEKEYSLVKIEESMMKTFGLSETVISGHLEEIQKTYPEVILGTRSHFPEIQISMRVKNAAKNPHSLIKVQDHIYKSIQNWIFSGDEKTLLEVIVHELEARGRTLCVFTNNVGGVLNEWVSELSNARDRITVKAFDGASKSDEQNIMHENVPINSTYISLSGSLQSDGAVELILREKDRSFAFSAALPYGGPSQKKKLFAMFALEQLRRRLLNIDFLNEVLGKEVKIKELCQENFDVKI